jgi:hypothetical protein
MITKEEARIFLGMVSDVGNENSISLKGRNPLNLFQNTFSFYFFLSSRISKSNARMENLNQFFSHRIFFFSSSLI